MILRKPLKQNLEKKDNKTVLQFLAFLIPFYVTVVLTILTSALTQCSCCDDYSQVMLTYCQSKRLPLGSGHLHLVSLSWCKNAVRPHRAAAVAPPDHDPARSADLNRVHQTKQTPFNLFYYRLSEITDSGDFSSRYTFTLSPAFLGFTAGCVVYDSDLQKRCWWRWAGRIQPRPDAGRSFLLRTQRWD